MAKDQIDFSLSGKYDIGQFLEVLVPLSVLLDSEFQITGVTSAMAKSVKNLKAGVTFSTLFHVIRPRTWGDLQNLEDTNYYVQVEEISSGRQFKCTKLNALTGGGFILAFSPIINAENGTSAFNLDVSDFAVHDIMA